MSYLFYCLFIIVSLNAPEILNTRLTDFLEQFIEVHDIPGLTVAITMENEIIYSKAFGVRNIESQEPMKMDYFFHMASVSKPFVATALMRLVEQGKMDLDKKVTLLPDKNIGLILAANYDRTPIEEIREGVLDILLASNDKTAINIW